MFWLSRERHADREGRAMKNGSSQSRTTPPASRPWWRRQIRKRLLLYPLIFYVALIACQERIIFPRHFAPAPDPSLRPAHAAIIQLQLEGGGQVPAWFFPVRTPGRPGPGPAVIVCHGNAEIIDQYTDIVAGYHRLGCSVLLPEYRGYGRADGSPSEAGILADMERFYDELISRADVDASRVVFHGRSLGGGVAAGLCRRRKPAALILESTFTSVSAMARRFLVPAFLIRHPFRTDQVVADLHIPLLIFHGTDDRTVPVRHGRRLHDLAPSATYIEYAGGHTDMPYGDQKARYWAEIAKMLQSAGIVGDLGGDGGGASTKRGAARGMAPR